MGVVVAEVGAVVLVCLPDPHLGTVSWGAVAADAEGVVASAFCPPLAPGQAWTTR